MSRRWFVGFLAGVLICGCATTSPTTYLCPVGGERFSTPGYCPTHKVAVLAETAPQNQNASPQDLQALLGILGWGLQAHQAVQQQKQVNAYNQQVRTYNNAVIQQQQAGARIMNAVANQAEQQ